MNATRTRALIRRVECAWFTEIFLFSHREMLSLIRLLEKYVAHVDAQPYTLLPRFMGAHRIRMPGGRKVKFARRRATRGVLVVAHACLLAWPGSRVASPWARRARCTLW